VPVAHSAPAAASDWRKDLHAISDDAKW